MFQGINETLLTLAVIAAFVLGLVYNDPTVKMLSLGALIAQWKGMTTPNKTQKGDTTDEKTTVTDIPAA